MSISIMYIRWNVCCMYSKFNRRNPSLINHFKYHNRDLLYSNVGLVATIIQVTSNEYNFFLDFKLCVGQLCLIGFDDYTVCSLLFIQYFYIKIIYYMNVNACTLKVRYDNCF